MVKSQITYKEKILYHLLKTGMTKGMADYSEDCTQKGIAEAVGTSRPHVSVALRSLVEEGLVRQSLEHVRGRSRRVNVYILTEEGRMQARRIATHIDSLSANPTTPQEELHKSAAEKKAVETSIKLPTAQMADIADSSSSTGAHPNQALPEPDSALVIIYSLVALYLLPFTYFLVSNDTSFFTFLEQYTLLYVVYILLSPILILASIIFILAQARRFLTATSWQHRLVGLAGLDSFMALFIAFSSIAMREIFQSSAYSDTMYMWEQTAGTFLLLAFVSIYIAYSRRSDRRTRDFVNGTVSAAAVGVALSIYTGEIGMMGASLAVLIALNGLAILRWLELSSPAYVYITGMGAAAMLAGILGLLRDAYLGAMMIIIAIPVIAWVVDRRNGLDLQGELSLAGGLLLLYLSFLSYLMGIFLGAILELALGLFVVLTARETIGKAVRERGVFLPLSAAAVAGLALITIFYL